MHQTNDFQIGNERVFRNFHTLPRIERISLKAFGSEDEKITRNNGHSSFNEFAFQIDETEVNERTIQNR